MNDLNDSASFETYAVDTQNPWLGLHPFTEDLQRFFYGRDDEADELYRRVNRKTLTVLFGQSGLGKTSLLRAGLFPKLRQAGFLPFAVRIVHTEEAPPLAEQVISALTSAARAANATLTAPATAAGMSLWEYFHRLEFSLKSAEGKALVPVLVFDQFEEVFTLGSENEQLRERSARLLTDLADLVENRPPKELQARLEADPDLVEQLQFDRADYRVLISLREDFLANLEDLRPRMPSLSENRMRLTRMNGEQALDAVTKPGAHLVSPIVSRQIVRFVAGASVKGDDRADVDLGQYEVDPAMLSLFSAELNNRRRAQGLPQITADLLAGNRETILRDYYERCLSDAHPEVRRWVEDELLTDTGLRVDVPLEKARKILVDKSASRDALDVLVKRRLLRIEERLHVARVELTHDVLTSVVGQSRDERRQEEQVRQSKEREQRIREQLRRARQRLVATVIIAASTIALITGAFYLYLDRWVWPHVTYYGNFSKRFGQVVGIGELSPSDLGARSVSFKVTKIGRGPSARVVSLEAVDSYGKPTGDHGVGSYLSYSSEDTASLLSRECRWEFVYDNDGRVVYEKAFNKLGKMVWCFVYSPSVDKEGAGDQFARTAHGHFIGEDGYPRPQRNSSAEYVEIQYSPEGWEVLRKYSDRNGNPQPGLDRAYGLAREYDELGRMTKTLSLDAQGRPMIDSAGNCGMIYSDYHELGNSRWSVSVDTTGKPLPVDSGWTKERREYDDHGNLLSSRYYDASDKPVRSSDGYAGYDYQRDQRGNAIKLTYVDEAGQPTKSNYGHAGWTSTSDERGELERHYLGADGKPTKSRLGIGIVKYERDAKGLVLKQSHFDENGKPTLSTEGVSGWTSKFDDSGQEIERRFFDSEGRPTRINTDKTAGWQATYDDRGNKVVTTYLGLDGKPGPNNNGVVVQKSEYDDFGNARLVKFYDEQGRPSRHKDGYAGYRARYDGRGYAIRYISLDEQGRPLKFKGIVGWDVEYDNLGNMIALRFIDESGNPAVHTDGHSGWSAKFDQANHEIERRYVDAAGKTTSRAKGPAYWQATYNQFGKPVEKAYFDPAGRPAPFEDGYNRIEYKYDPSGRKQEEVYYYEARPHAKGFRREVYKYDEYERNTGVEYTDEQGKPYLVDGRYARTAYDRDANGLITRRRNFDAEGKPALNDKGIAGSTSEYDDRGNETVRRHLDASGKPTLNADKVATVASKFDGQNNEIRREFWDLNDRLTLNHEGIAGWESKFDATRHEIERTYFDASGAPTLTSGYARITFRYDQQGNLAEKCFFDVAGKMAAMEDGTTRIQYEYDRSGRETKRKYHCELQPNKRSFSTAVWTFDERGNVISKAYLDEREIPTVDEQNIHRYEYEYRDDGRTVKQSFFDTQGAPTLSAEGLHGWTSQYDERNNEVKRSFFDVERKPTLLKNMYASWTSRYNQLGKLIERAYFGLNGEIAGLSDGIIRQVYEYDDAGRLSKRTDYYKQQANEDGHQGETWTFDEQGNTTSITFLDAEGKLMLSSSGVARISLERDSKGRIVRRRFFDRDMKPTLSVEEIAGWKSIYDARGNEIGRWFMGMDDKPTLIKDSAFASWSADYNDKGRKIAAKYFDAAGIPAEGPDGSSGYRHTIGPDGRLEQTTYEYQGGANTKGFAKANWQYDEAEKVTGISFLDAENHPTRNPSGYYRVTFLYDSDGKQTQKRYHYELDDEKAADADSAPTDGDKTADGSSKKYPFSYSLENFDKNEHVTSATYHRRDGQLAIGDEGYAKCVTDFDATGNSIANRYFDDKEHPLQAEVLVAELVPGSQAESLKIQVDDVLLTYDGKPITDKSSFIYGRSQEKPGGAAKRLVVRRGSEELGFDVAPGQIGMVLTDRIPSASRADE